MNDIEYCDMIDRRLAQFSKILGNSRMLVVDKGKLVALNAPADPDKGYDGMVVAEINQELPKPVQDAIGSMLVSLIDDVESLCVRYRETLGGDDGGSKVLTNTKPPSKEGW